VRAVVFALTMMAAAAGPGAQAAGSQVGVAGSLDQKTAAQAFPARRPCSPYVGANVPTRPYFGDTHLHTSYSMDAGAFGARLTPRETCATTGTRMIVRFFGGWDFEPNDAGKSPSFLVAALKDPLGANLDRIQIVKGWLDARGELHEQVYDVAWGDADKRSPGQDGRLPPVGSTVDVANASWTNTIGDPELITV
jgi:hypothetical protein